MIVYLHGFNWKTYTQNIMPAFMQWLLDGNEEAIYQLYQQTRCAHEEHFLPPVMHQIRTWPRAQACARHLPQGKNIRHEYEIICSPERFTAISDTYDCYYYPTFYQNVDGLRTIWNALIAEYCLFNLASTEQEVHHHRPYISTRYPKNQTPFWLFIDDAMDLQDPFMHLTAWLAGISPDALTLFEYLACERRAMPFGYRVGTPYENCSGYLTPTETEQLLLYLQNSPSEPAVPYSRQELKLIKKRETETDNNAEIIHEQVNLLLAVVRLAVKQNAGIICSCD